jgi:hypothetical protein
MLALIPRLRGDLEQSGLLPGTSHGTLFLELPNNPTQIHIWGEGAGKYRIYLYMPAENQMLDGRVVGENTIIPAIAEHLHNLSMQAT